MSEIRVTSVVGENGGDRVGLTTGLTVGPLTGTTGIGATISHQGHAQFVGVCTATSFVPTTGQLSHRNLIINGAMNVAQRGTSHGSSGYRTVDRFQFSGAGLNASITTAQVDVASGTTPYTSGFRKAYKLTNGAQTGPDAGDTMVFLYRVEAQDLANSGWNYTSSSSYVTFSYWVKSSVAQNFFVTLKSSDGTPQKYATETGSLSADTWTKITKTIPGNSNLTFNNDNGEGLEIEWSIFRGTDETGSMSLNTWAANNNSVRTPDQTSTWYTTNDATFEITGVQLEVGSVATDFEHRSFGQELALCQRYCYEHLFPEANQFASIMLGCYYNSSRVYGSFKFPVSMRTAPTMVCTDSADAFNVYRDGGVDFVNEFHIDSSNNVGCNGAEILNDTDASGTSGHAAFVRRGANSTTIFRFEAEL